MEAFTKIKSASPDVLRWLDGMQTKYSVEDMRKNSGSPLEQDFVKWANGITQKMKKKIRASNSEATKALLQSVVALPLIRSYTSLINQIKAEDYIDYLDKGVSGTKKDRNSPYKFKNEFVSEKMVKELQMYIAAKPVSLNPKKGQSKKELNEQVAYAMAKSVKRKGIKARYIYGSMIKEGSREIEELKEITQKNLGAMAAASIVTAIISSTRK